MVEIEEIPTTGEEEERYWIKIGYLSERQEDVLREFAYKHGYMTLRGFWMAIQAEEWTYYEIFTEYKE